MFQFIFFIVLLLVVYRFVSKWIYKDENDPHYDKEKKDKELKLKNKNLNLNLDSKRQKKKIAEEMIIYQTMTIKNNFLFLLIFILISNFSFHLPDIDQSDLSFLGHRSIITHSFLIPFLFNYFLDKKCISNIFIRIIAISLFFGFSVHFCADLIVKGWQGGALITGLGIRLPAPISIIWIFANAIICMVCANTILRKFFNFKSTSYLFYFLGTLIAINYFDKDYVSEPVQQFIIFILIHSVVFFYFSKINNKKTIKKTIRVTENLDGVRHNTSFISPTFFWFCLVGVFILSLFFIFPPDNKKSKNVVDNWRLKGVYEDESKACEKQIIQKNPNVNIVELKSYKSFQIIRDNNQIKKIITYDVKKNVFILGEMSFGTFDCYLDLKNDTTFSFLRLIQK